MGPIVEFCQSNLGAGTESVRRELAKDPSIDIIEYECLGFCTTCASTPYALVNGVMVKGESTKSLLHNILEEIEKSDAFF